MTVPLWRRTGDSETDGWDEECHRAFIAALSLTGSIRAACRAVGKSAFGVEQLLRHEGSEGFRAAYDQAMAISGDERSRRLAEGLRTVAAEQAGWRPPDPPWANARTRAAAQPRPAQALTADEAKAAKEIELEQLRGIVRTYIAKLAAERRCRLAGKIAEADFYLRQLTFCEIAIEFVTADAVAALEEVRRDGHDLLIVAETPMSRLLDEVRRRHWLKCGEPPRPEPPRHLYEQAGGCTIEPLEHRRSSPAETDEEQRRRFEERHARDAQAQIEWEAEARRDYEERRARAEAGSPSLAPGEGKAGEATG